MARFTNVTEQAETKRLDYGKHLVEITNVKNTDKDGNLSTDDSGAEIWNVTFQDATGAKHYEYMRFSGVMANKTGYLFRAVGILPQDMKLSECDKDFLTKDIIGKKLYIEIEENKKATNDKYKKQIKYDGFEPAEEKAGNSPW